MPTVFPEGKYKTTPFVLADANETTVYTCTEKWAYVVQIWLADDGGSARTATLTATLGGTKIRLAVTEAVAANTAVSHEPFMQLLADDIVQVTSDAAGLEGFITTVEPVTQIEG